MKLKRTEYDDLGEQLIRKAKELDPQMKTSHLVRLFGRAYSRLLSKLREEKKESGS